MGSLFFLYSEHPIKSRRGQSLYFSEPAFNRFYRFAFNPISRSVAPIHIHRYRAPAVAETACVAEGVSAVNGLPEGRRIPVKHISEYPRNVGEYLLCIFLRAAHQRFVFIYNMRYRERMHLFDVRRYRGKPRLNSADRPAEDRKTAFKTFIRRRTAADGECLAEFGFMFKPAVTQIGEIFVFCVVPEDAVDSLVNVIMQRSKFIGVGIVQLTADISHSVRRHREKGVKRQRINLFIGSAFSGKPGHPFEEVPVAALVIKLPDNSDFPAPRYNRSAAALESRQYLRKKLPVAAVAQIFGRLQREYRVERGNSPYKPRGRADIDKSVLPNAESKQLKRTADNIGFAESVLPEQHLVAGIHVVKRLLPPRAVLVMLVHAHLQRPF